MAPENNPLRLRQFQSVVRPANHLSYRIDCPTTTKLRQCDSLQLWLLLLPFPLSPTSTTTSSTVVCRRPCGPSRSTTSTEWRSAGPTPNTGEGTLCCTRDVSTDTAIWGPSSRRTPRSVWHPLLGLQYSWRRHHMETFSALLPLCEGNSPVTGEFPSQSTMTRSFDVFFDLHLNRRLSKHLRRNQAHFDVTVIYYRCPVSRCQVSTTHLKIGRP